MMLMMYFFLLILVNLNLKNFFKKKLIQINFSIYIIYLLMNCLLMIDWWSMFYYFGLEFYNYMLILLTLWIMMLIMNSINLKIYKFEYCMNLILILCLILILSFMSLSIFMFYLFFEISLIPTFLMIIFWGMSSERISSSYYLLFYTMFFSLPMLIILFMLFNTYFTSFMYLFKFMNLNLNLMFYMILIMTFLVKLPIFLFHSWLLKAHVEAPYFGSMILAALLLKLGSYGLLRIMEMFYFNSFINNYLFISLSMLGMMMISLLCLRQIDMKLMIAYSSVVHMGMLISGMFTLTKIGLIGGYLMMISHGLCSSGLFYMINLIYEKSNSRLMIINKGIMNLMPSLSLMWFLLCSSNMSAPLSLNLISELMLLSSLMFYMINFIIFLMIICFISFLYSLYLFSFIFHGQMLKFNFNMNMMLEYYITLMHWIPLNLMFMNMLFFIY